MKIYIGLHGKEVPNWLQTVTPNADDSVMGKLKWVGLSVVTLNQGAFLVRPLLPQSFVMRLSRGHNLTICGQSPAGGPGNVFISMKPLVPGWFAGALAAVMASAVFLAFKN